MQPHYENREIFTEQEGLLICFLIYYVPHRKSRARSNRVRSLLGVPPFLTKHLTSTTYQDSEISHLST